MNKRLVTMAAVFLISGCGVELPKQSAYDLEQRRRLEQENAAKEAGVRQEQEELDVCGNSGANKTRHRTASLRTKCW